MWNWLDKLAELRDAGVPSILVTVSDAQGSTPREIGAKMIVDAEGRLYGSIGGGELERQAILEAQKRLRENTSGSVRYPLGAQTGQCCGGQVSLLFESMGTQPLLYIFGAGHVGQAIANVMQGTPFEVHLIDPRPEWIDHPDLPRESIRHAEDWDDFADFAKWDPSRTYALVLTHQHALDQAILENLLERPTRFLGLIGSRAKWKRFQKRMALKQIPQEKWSAVHCPMGLDIGGRSPQEIAISVAAQLLQVFYGKRSERTLSADIARGGTVLPYGTAQGAPRAAESSLDT